MKKLLVLALVLSVASLANASFFLSVDGVVNPPDSEIMLLPSETAIIDVFGSGNSNLPLDFWIICQGPGTISGGVVLYPGNLSEITTMSKDEWEAAFEAPGMFEGVGFPGTTSASYFLLADSVVPPAILDGLLVDEIAFHCDGPGDVTLSLIGGALDSIVVYDTQVIHQIPEPATIALLCLGGLLLRKK